MEFDSLRLEAWSSARVVPPGPSPHDDMRALSEALGGFERPAVREEDREEDAVPLTTPGGEELGVVRFRFAHHYAHEVLVRDYFEREFVNPQRAWVIRVSEPGGGRRVRERAHEEQRELRGHALPHRARRSRA